MADADFEKAVFKRLDEHGESIHKIREVVAVLDSRVTQVENAQISSCKIMTETRQEVVTLIGNLQSSVQSIQLYIAAEQGKREQNKLMMGIFFSITAILPTISVILFAMNGK